MASIDPKVFFTALGFLTVVLNDTPKNKQAQRAIAIAGLIENFCRTVTPEAFNDEKRVDNLSIEHRMAYLIANLIEMHGECEPDDLRNRGFSQGEIKKHWKMVYALASVSLNMKPKDL